jgi:PAS domain S-box-containing protein
MEFTQNLFQKKLLILGGITVIYIAIFFLVYPLLERATLVFAFLPIIASALLFRQRGGSMVALAMIPLNLLILLVIEHSTLQDFMKTNYWATHFAYMLVGLTMGYMQELKERLLLELLQRQQIEQNLYISEQRYRLLVENFPKSTIVLYDHDLRFSLVDGPEVTEVGFSKEMLEGKTLYETLPPEYVQIFEPNMRIALAGQLHETELAWKDEKYYRHSYVPLKDDKGKTIMAMILAQNVTEQRHTLEQLQASQNRYRALFHQSHDAVFILDLSGAHAEANQAAANMLGYTIEEMNNLSFREIVVPDEHSGSENVLKKILAGERIPLYERRFRKKNGETLLVEINVELVLDEAGNPLHIQSIARDISERKYSQEKELMLALQMQKTSLLTKLISDFSHDLKTPLSIINTSVYLLSKTIEQEQSIAKLAVIKEQVKHLEKVFEDMLTISRLEGLTVPSFHALNLNRLAQEIATKFHDQAQAKNISIDLQIAHHLPIVLGDKETIFLALGELVENAVNYTLDGGQITVKTRMDETHIIVEIQDTGQGISESDMPHIFEYFFRGDYARSIETGGAGLGLCIVQKVVEVHGASLEVETMPGQGTCFRIKFLRLDKIDMC